MSLGEQVMSRAVEPALLRVCQWRGDPVARLMLPATRTDPYPLYARVRQRGLVRSPLGAFIAADHATVASVLRDRRFSSSPTHQRGYRPPSYPPDDPRPGCPTETCSTWTRPTTPGCAGSCPARSPPGRSPSSSRGSARLR